MVSVGSLIGKEVAPILGKDYINKGSRFYDYAIELNSLGNRAKEFSEILSVLTGADRIIDLTLVSLRNLLPSRGLLTTTKKWCPLCLENWKKSNQIIYEPLIWYFKQVNLCKIHECRLKTECPQCSKPVLVLTRTSRNGYCSNCGSWLGNDIKKTSDIINFQENLWENYVVNNIGNLLKTSEAVDSYSSDNIILFIKTILEKIGGISAFSRYFNIPKSTASTWISGEHRPSLYSLLKICYKLDIDIMDAFKANQKKIYLIPNDELQIKDTTQRNNDMRKKRNQRNICWVYIEKILINIISNKEKNAPSLREASRNLNCDARLLYNHFPELCKKISENYNLSIQFNKQRKHEENCKKVLEATAILHKKGIYPTKRKVENILPSNISLRRKVYYEAWKDSLRKLDK